ncbi:MAG: cytochrome c biogenesis protein CcdA [Chloroflexi bacterium]|nr:cytochrome c biogenesis protein CcdA [Chloroflexota bacterium]
MTTKDLEDQESKTAALGWVLPITVLLGIAAVGLISLIIGRGNLTALPLAWAFSAGTLATVNPCGWAMLPSYAAFYLGSREAGYEHRPLIGRGAEGLRLGLLMTAGFLVVFSIVGAVISLGLRILVQAMPFLAILVGVGLVGLGLWLLFGGSLRLSIPTPRINAQARNPKSVFLYGAAYGFASLSCTLPIFMIVIGSSLATGSPGEAAAMFGSFAAGMAMVLMAVVISIALVKGAIVQQLQAVLPYVHRIGAGLLVVAGLYLIWYQARYLPLFLATF